MDRNSAARIPSAQDEFHPRLDRFAVMGRMRIVHRGDVGRDRRSYRIVVIRVDPNAARALDHKTRMAEKGNRNRFLCRRSRKPQRPPGNRPAPVHAAHTVCPLIAAKTTAQTSSRPRCKTKHRIISIDH
jgi:hypothetical protein